MVKKVVYFINSSESSNLGLYESFLLQLSVPRGCKSFCQRCSEDLPCCLLLPHHLAWQPISLLRWQFSCRDDARHVLLL